MKNSKDTSPVAIIFMVLSLILTIPTFANFDLPFLVILFLVFLVTILAGWIGLSIDEAVKRKKDD